MSANSPSYYLFARPSFLEGFARIFDFGATLQTYNESPTDTKADIAALKQDWLAVGNDLRTSMNEYAQQCQPTPTTAASSAAK